MQYPNCSTLIEVLRWRATHQPERLAYTYLVDGENDEITLTYEALDRRARAIAAVLQRQHSFGKRALLIYPPGLEYIASFFGCLYAGAIAVPAYPPQRRRIKQRLESIVTNAQIEFALTTTALISKTESLLSSTGTRVLPQIATDDVSDDLADDWHDRSVDANALALLQYTSGSTSTPKGVMVSHNNLMHNERAIQTAFKQTDQSIIVGWLPFYHDMGLIGNILQPLYTGAPCILMSPLAFLQRPFRWLQAISRYKGTTSGGPNFAYELCARKITAAERDTLDLSSWSVAFNGSEPIRAETLELFASTFADCGFRLDAFRPCYGLAEATLLVSSHLDPTPPSVKTIQAVAVEQHRIDHAQAETADGFSFVSCGEPLLGQKIVIVNPETLSKCLSNEIGEIWISGPSVARGYWNSAKETDEVFHAHLADTGEGPFLRTGDLGFLLDGKLFVTGRLKDLIIIRGRNLYPTDIELTVERCHSALRQGCGAAFSVEIEAEERLVVVQEIDLRQDAPINLVLDNIRESVSEEFEVSVHAVVLIKPGSIPKTSSGKIQRRASRVKFLEGTLDVVSQWQAEATYISDAAPLIGPHSVENLEEWLAQQLASVLRVDVAQINVDEPVTRYGIDSLMAIELLHQIQFTLAVNLPLTSFFQNSSLAQLATQIREQLTSNGRSKSLIASVQQDGTESLVSYGQRALWILHKIAPDSAAYNIAHAARIRSQLDVKALRRAVQTLLDRHASLRTTYEVRQGTPIPIVHKNAQLRFQEVDTTSWSETALKDYVTAEAHRPFDLTKDLPVRVCLLKKSEQEYILLFVVHHIAADLWSLAVLTHELGLLYTAEAAGNPITLGPGKLQYTDYARFQKELLSSEEGERLARYWRQKLSGELPLLNLPTDRPRPSMQTFRGGLYAFGLDVNLTRGLRDLSERRNSTLFMVLLAVFQVLLHRYTGQDEILVGTPTAGRNRAELSGLVGYLVNPVVIRVSLSEDPTFETFLRQVRRDVLDAIDHQDYPFALLVEQLKLDREPSRSPIFQAMFVWQETSPAYGRGLPAFALGEEGAPIKVAGLELEPYVFDQQTSQFDLTLAMAEAPGGLRATLQYNTDLFEPATVARIAADFRILLEDVVANPGRHVSALSLVSEQNREQLLREWNDTRVAYPDKCLHHFFEEQVERTPDALAIIWKDTRLTYRELNNHANQLGRFLKTQGVQAEVLVGICMDRSVEMVVAVLGVLKAGGGYVPLDPTYPKERLDYMVKDSRPTVILTQRKFVERLPEHSINVVCLDTDATSINTFPDEDVKGTVTSQSIAYVIYTSGSTGNPKGVVIPHHSIVNHMLWMQQVFPLETEDRVLQKTPFSFDASVWEFHAPLMSGATLVMAESGGHRERDYLLRTLRDERITILQLVPSQLDMLLAGKGLEECESLRRVFCGGEILKNAQVRQFYKRVKHARLYNLYGPTEATIEATCGECAAEEQGTIASIGRPIANTQTYILDTQMQPVPVGVIGELYIGGAGVGLGYLHRPELTAERFVPDPFSRMDGARLYRTGDIGRYLADGRIECLGRLDQQVKVRGYRIELGEVEAALREHAAVKEAVVVVRGLGASEKQLVAYVVGEESAGPELGQELRGYLRDRLPEYMVPALFVVLDELPLTANAKIDRRALPPPDASRAADKPLVEPRNEVEATLAEIWREVLRLQEVGVHDNFFESGGDSILAIQIIARANQVGLRLAPKDLFQHRTIAELALVAAQAHSSAAAAEVKVPSGPLPLTPIQQWFFAQQLTNAAHFNQAVLLVAERRLEWRPLEASLARLLREHEALRLRFSYDAQRGEWRQHYDEGNAGLPLIEIDLSALAAGPERTAAMEAACTQLQASLDIEAGPLLWLAVFELGPDESQRLLWCIHHLAVDGVSWRILLNDWQAWYEQAEHGVAALPSVRTSSYGRWALALQRWAQSEIAEAEAGYWLDWGEVEWLPVDHRREGNTVASTRSVMTSLSALQTEALLQQAPAIYHTRINDLLLTALGRAFGRWSGMQQVLIDMEGHGREPLESEELDLTRTVGWFTTLYPLRLRTDVREEIGVAIKWTKEELRQVPRQGLSYGAVRYLSGKTKLQERLAAAERAEVSFNYLGQLDQALPAQGWLRATEENSGASRDANQQRSHLLEIVSVVQNERLQIVFNYSEAVHGQTSIERLAESYRESLVEVLDHCASEGAGGYTPSDFPQSGLNQQQLDQEVGRRDVEDIYMLSPMQEGFLFHALYAPDSAVYFEQMSCRLEGRLEVENFRQAWAAVIRRHTVLRSRFVWEGVAQPVQIVEREVELPWREADWSGLSEAEQEERLEAALARDREAGFKLGEAPLMRMTLLRLGPESYELIWSHHHLVLDGWSLPVLLQEVKAYYEGYCRGEEVELERSRSYGDYIKWLRTQDLGAAEEYWREQLRGFKAPTPLGLSSGLNEVGVGQEYGEKTISLPESLSKKLQQLSRAEQVTLNTIMQGAWGVLLSRYSGEPDVVFGATVSGRPAGLAGVETMVGVFINALPVRVQVKREQTVKAYLAQLQAEQLEARQYEYSPLVSVQSLSEVAPGEPLFESLFIFENYPRDVSVQQLRGVPSDNNSHLSISLTGWFEQTNYPLTLMIFAGEMTRIRISYDKGRFSLESIERLLDHLQVLLEAMTESPQCRVTQLSLLTETERSQLLWLGRPALTGALFTSRCVHQLISAQAQRTPGRTAVYSQQQTLTYEELDRRSTQLAHYLKHRGVGAEAIVAVALERSVSLLIGLLGVLKAGGAYLPLEAKQPGERQQLILQDARPQLLLTEKGVELPADGVPRVWLEEVWSEVVSQAERRDEVSGENLAYVLYTSGSTGVPKGVGVPHSALVNLLEAMGETLGCDPEDRLLAVTTLTFDIAGLELYLPLLVGGTVEIAAREEAGDGAWLAKRLRSGEVTMMQGTPATWRMVLESGWEGDSGVRVLCGGEALSADLAVELVRRSAVVWNLYGPTETTIWSAVQEVKRGAAARSIVSIGRGIRNTDLYVLDQEHELVPIGVSGELCISGAGLARGYLGRAELTAEKFIAHPFNVAGGERLYRTGDLVRWRANGELEFIGRIDEQVKVRGFRVELGEVEAVLRKHAAVKEAVVVTREDQTRNKDLVAYIVASAEFTRHELRTFLEQRLPEYMIPSAFVMLEAVPLTPSGKVDRRALPVPDLLRLASEDDFAAPENLVEQVLAEIWAEVLGVELIGVNTNFFTIGGHSLRVIKVVSRVREVFDIELPMQSCFQAPTIRSLGAVITMMLEERGVRLEDDSDQLMTELEQLSEEEINELLTDHE